MTIILCITLPSFSHHFLQYSTVIQIQTVFLKLMLVKWPHQNNQQIDFELWQENSKTSKVSYHKMSTLPSLSVNGVRLNEAMLCRKRINGQFSGKNLSLHNSQHKSYRGRKTRLFRSVRTTQNCSHIELCVHTFPTTRDSQEVISTTAKGPHFGTSLLHQRRVKPRSTNNISLDALK